VSQSPKPMAQSSPGAKPAHMRNAGASQKRGRLAKMCFGVIAVGVSIAAFAMVAMVFITEPPPMDEASRSGPNSVGTIVLHSGSSGCQQRSFDNQTGQIADKSSPCLGGVVRDAKGMPVPAGTIHTLSSISKSFN
jgi:hypothetical protein